MSTKAPTLFDSLFDENDDNDRQEAISSKKKKKTATSAKTEDENPSLGLFDDEAVTPSLFAKEEIDLLEDNTSVIDTQEGTKTSIIDESENVNEIAENEEEVKRAIPTLSIITSELSEGYSTGSKPFVIEFGDKDNNINDIAVAVPFSEVALLIAEDEEENKEDLLSLLSDDIVQNEEGLASSFPEHDSFTEDKELVNERKETVIFNEDKEEDEGNEALMELIDINDAEKELVMAATDVDRSDESDLNKIKTEELAKQLDTQLSADIPKDSIELASIEEDTKDAYAITEMEEAIDIVSNTSSFVSLLEEAQQLEDIPTNTPTENDFVIEIKSDANVDKDAIEAAETAKNLDLIAEKQEADALSLDQIMRVDLPYQFDIPSKIKEKDEPSAQLDKPSAIIFDTESAIALNQKNTKNPKTIEKETADTVMVSDEKIELEDWVLDKNYYSIGIVAKMFDVNISHIRFWTNEFNLKPRTNKKGDRLYTPENIKILQLIHHLVKVQHHTIKGAKEKLKNRKEAVAAGRSLKDYLVQLKVTLEDLRSQIQ